MKENISNHISYNEAIHSNTAKSRKIDNTPSPDTIVRMKYIAYNVFEPLRKWYGKPIYVNSFYRSSKLNQIIGGSKNSQHIKGEAIDISVRSKEGNKVLFEWIKENVEFDQLINEKNFSWIHVSLKLKDNRNMVFNIN